MSTRNIVMIIFWIVIILGTVYLAVRLNDNICDEGKPACDDEKNCYCMYEIAEEDCGSCESFCVEKGRIYFHHNVKNGTCICRCLQ